MGIFDKFFGHNFLSAWLYQNSRNDLLERGNIKLYTKFNKDLLKRKVWNVGETDVEETEIKTETEKENNRF